MHVWVSGPQRSRPLLMFRRTLQETFLKSCHTAKIRRYGCVRKETEGSSVSGGVCIFTSFDVPSSALSLRTSLQAVAVRIHSTRLFTICCLYLPPNAVIRQQDMNDLVVQLPAPFFILGDFSGYSTLWGSMKTNPRGRQIEHDLYNSDHFPVVLSHDYDAGGKTFPPRYSYSRADWALFTQLAMISDAMVRTESVDTAVQEITNVLIAAADLSIPKVSSHTFQRYKLWWNADCVRQRIRTSGSYGESFVDIPLWIISWRSKRQKQMLAE
ncbi:CCHC-type domain-containing protein [Trichonephila clavipes]|uniref:CCHC-type domain-containing protein n=1 Tax=Trichonephila clavipes TaxID=2585209 RepID=A0A8X6VEX2_TRICX|nr:CCHC-type domain-containing protein [Trichonephila clavipes]